MGNNIKYTCTALVGVNKTGELKPDSDGYYTLVVGALDSFNSAGAFYPLEPARALFEESSSFMRRVKDGSCKGECGHPKPLPGQSTREFIQRVLQIEETKVCAHFKSFTLDSSSTRDAGGKPITTIIAEVKPAGPMGPALKEALENKHENVCFSIRSLTHDFMSPAGYLQKNLNTIVTFDWVTEPGISVAKKWFSPALEQFSETVVLPQHLDTIERLQKDSGISMEHNGLDIESIRKSVGWERTVVSNTNRPKSIDW